MPKSFNLDGPCIASKHYMIPASRRLGDEILDLIDNEKYFLLQAPRQTGKTTLLFDLTKRINTEGKYHALYCSLEGMKMIANPEKGIGLLIDTIMGSASSEGLPNSELLGKREKFGEYTRALQTALSEYCKSLDKPLVLFFDEADSLSGDFLISVLSQLRIGYNNRKLDVPFVHSLALVGMRNIRDYKYDPKDPDSTVGNTSPFNITRPLMLRDFTQEEITELYGQYTDQTGQAFTQDAVDLAFSMTLGQPWLVNAIGDLTTKAAASDPGTPITGQMVTDAVQSLVLSREVHIGNLNERLKDSRVRKVLAPLITGDIIEDRMGDDFNYVMDLGLIRDDGNGARFANPIYAEVILRTLTYEIQNEIKLMHPELVLSKFIKDGEVLVDDLLGAYVNFWRENSEMWEKRWEYEESAPHIVMQAFMQRIVNGGAILTREAAEGNGRLDIGIMYGVRKYPIELKIRRSNKSLEQAKTQILRYMDRMGVRTGWIMLFDRRKTLTWEQKVWFDTMEVDGKTIKMYGC